MRRWARRVVVVLGLLLVVALAVLLALDLAASRRLAAAQERFEADVAPLEYASLLRPALDNTSNAATWIQAGASALVLSAEHQEAAAELARRKGSEWSAADRDVAAALAAEAGPAFELLEKSLSIAASDFGIEYPAGINAELPDLMPLLRVVRLARIRGSLAVHQGERRRALRDLAIIGRVGDALGDESLLITAIVTMGADWHYLGLLKEALPLLESGDLERIAADLARRGRGVTLERALRADATMVSRTSAADFADATSNGRGLLARPVVWLSSGWYKRETARALDSFRLLIGNLQRTVPEGERLMAERSFDGPGEHMLVPNLRWTVARYRATEAARLLAASALATRLAGLATGAYAVEPILLPATEPDPFAGGEITFERRADGSALLAAPAAAELWEARDSNQRRPPPPFAWELPPIAASLAP